MAPAYRFLVLFVLATLFMQSCSLFTRKDDAPHRQGVGTSAEDFLRSDQFTSLIVEIDYHRGFGPLPEAVENLETFLNERLNKPGGITVTLSDAIPTSANNTSLPIQYTRDDIVDLENEYRDIYSDETTLAMYFIFVDGRFEPDNGTLGFAYFNTSCTLMGHLVNNLSGRRFQSTTAVLQTNVMLHEFSHLLGLVNDGTPMVEDHETSQRAHHCTITTCLMRPGIPNVGGLRSLGPFCLQDLKANGGK